MTVQTSVVITNGFHTNSPEWCGEYSNKMADMETSLDGMRSIYVRVSSETDVRTRDVVRSGSNSSLCNWLLTSVTSVGCGLGRSLYTIA